MEAQDTCKNCEAELNGPFCSQCGQVVISKRITVRNLISYILSAITNVERGLWFTLNGLLRRPATVIQEYVNGRTRPYYHPLRLAFLLGTISIVLMFAFFDFEAAQASFAEQLNPNISEEQKELQLKANRAIRPFMNFLPLLLIPFFAIGTWWFHRKKQFNYAEHLVLNAYLYSLMTLVNLPLLLLYIYLDNIMLSTVMGFLLFTAFGGIIFKKLFAGSLLFNLLKALLSYLMGFIIFMFVSGIIGIIVGLTYAILNGGFAGGS